MRNVPRAMAASRRANHLFNGIESCFETGIVPKILTSPTDRAGFAEAFNELVVDLVDPVESFRRFHDSVNFKSQFVLLIDAIGHRVKHLGVDLGVLKEHGLSGDRTFKDQAKLVAAQINCYLELMCHYGKETYSVEPLVRNKAIESVFGELRPTFFDAHLHSGDRAERFHMRVSGTPLVEELSELRAYLDLNSASSSFAFATSGEPTAFR